MMGRTHLATGVATGLAVCAVADPPAAMVPLIVIVAAYSALVPDVDHPSAPAARVLGPVSWLLCWVVRSISARLTGTTHRGWSHSIAFCLLWGGLVAAGMSAVPHVTGSTAAWTGTAAAVGAVTHLAGDAGTRSGLQWVFWPYGPSRSWWPWWLRFTTGGPAERVIHVAVVVAAVVLTPAAVAHI